MRTTFTLDPDVVSAVDQLRRDEGIGISEAVNRLIRKALASRSQRAAYQHSTSDLGITRDVSNIGEVLDLLDES